MRRGEGRVRNTLQLLGFHVVRLEGYVPRRSYHSASGVVPQISTGGLKGSPLDNAGPIPVELRGNPFPGESIPWGMQMAEIERDRTRERLVWVTAVLVSWLVAGAMILRALSVI